MNINPKLTSLAKLDLNMWNLLKMLTVKSLPFTSKKINSGKTCQLKRTIVTSMYIFLLCNISKYTYLQDGYRMVCFCTNFIRNYLEEDPKT